MKNFKMWNNIGGWLSFAIAAVVYLLTIEPTTSLWDCGEFIASAFKLEVGHPPGAPVFMLLGRFASLFAFGNVENVAMMINALSALASAFTIMFLFWTITYMARKIILSTDKEITLGNSIAILGSGLVGALAYTFSDTFWFSAVEGEVYATSSLFTAVVFWAILKWEHIADEKHSNRWLILIAYLMGLSIGVHLLNLLAIPAIVMVYYFKKFNPTRNGIVYALLFSAILLGTIMWGIIPGIPKVASWFELLFVNGFGMPIKSGALIFLALAIAGLIYGIMWTHKQKRVILNTALVAVAVIMIGYSSFTMIVIRSLANPPMDENNPENMFSLMYYLNREQYGDRPLFKGNYYNAPVIDTKEGKPVYSAIDGKYVITDRKLSYEYDPQFTTIFPRMYSPQPDHKKAYQEWGNVTGRPIRITNNQTGEPEIRNVPTFGENLRFFFVYQVGHMYWRYFMWNFSGRQNDDQSHGSIIKGNWITGITPLDEIRLGPLDKYPSSLSSNKAMNKYYMLPFLLGLIGLFYHYRTDNKNFWVVTLLFVLTGLAIVVYLNQYPFQPRERDYAYAGSFYAFTIWIGLGVLTFYDALKRFAKPVGGATLATVGWLVLVPGIMASENWDDHDRSDRYTARDFAYNYLNSCDPNAVLFTNGDNDTFPLWYIQEVEGVRTDVRVVNLSLLNTSWYIDQMKRQAYESEPVPFSLTTDQYRDGTRNVVYIVDQLKKPVDVKQVVEFIASDNPKTKLPVSRTEKIDYIPTRQIRIPVDKQKVLENGIVPLEDSAKIVDYMEFTLEGNYIEKNVMMILDLLATNNWERPIYFVSTSGDGDIGLSDYMQMDGFAYKLVPIKTPSNDFLSIGRIDSDILYDHLMNKFEWGNMEKEDVLIEYYNIRTASVIKIRNKFARLAETLIEEGKTDSALAVLDRGMELMPNSQFPYDIFVMGLIEGYYKAGASDKANTIVNEFADITKENLYYFMSLPQNLAASVDYEMQVNMHILQQLVRMAYDYDNELGEKLEADFQSLYMGFVGQQG